MGLASTCSQHRAQRWLRFTPSAKPDLPSYRGFLVVRRIVSTKVTVGGRESGSARDLRLNGTRCWGLVTRRSQSTRSRMELSVRKFQEHIAMAATNTPRSRPTLIWALALVAVSAIGLWAARAYMRADAHEFEPRESLILAAYADLPDPDGTRGRLSRERTGFTDSPSSAEEPLLAF